MQVEVEQATERGETLLRLIHALNGRQVVGRDDPEGVQEMAAMRLRDRPVDGLGLQERQGEPVHLDAVVA